MTESTAKPSDIILKFLEEILASWKAKRYKKVTEQCVALLKRRKTIENLGMTVPLQRILLQAYMLTDRYEKVVEWEKTGSSSTATSASANQRGACEDLVLYARYRTGDYASVSKQSAGLASTAETNDNGISAAVFQNLQAQSEFHLNRTEEGLAVYLQLLSNDSIDDDDVESKMEIVTNALALVASSGCTPMVNLNDDDENLQFWLEEAEAMLLRDDEAVDSMFADLASNLGCIRFLTDPTKISGTEENWLEEAADTGDDNGAKKMTPEQTNLQWSKHFWYKDIEDVQYDVGTPSKSKTDNTNKPSVTESVAKVNQSLMDENLSRLPPLPHPKWNLLQVRMYWYNRAILQLKAGKYVECHDSCQSLKKTVSNVASAQGASKKKKKNKDGTAAVSNTSQQSPTTSWWEARADVILAYAQQGQSKSKDASSRLSERVSVLKAASPSIEADHAMTHVLLHQFVMEQQQQKGKKKDQQRQQRELLTVLKSLPESIQSRPAAQLTIDDLQDAVDNATSNNKTKSTPKSPLEEADMVFGEGQYEEACKLYETALSGGDSSSSTNMDSQLRYVQALAMSGRHEASQDLWQSLESIVLEENTSASASLPDGGALENKALPRSTTTSARSSAISNKLAATGNALDDEDDSDKPSREKILRRRAVKREAYLEELESKGQYNPDHPTKPDPERWIPKHERSRSSRNRGGNRGGGRNNNKGLNSAQGGGSKLDAERLDAAARRAGKVSASSGPSSANLKVSSGGRKGRRR
jgi:hypothetical protein